ncbi:MAG TPA: type IV pilus secretin PilQ [Anaeromyxobacteraceae bacterium]|nr:type IV pilus secretin PilQ [Anaeromyxobacteraceae bacterium]
MRNHSQIAGLALFGLLAATAPPGPAWAAPSSPNVIRAVDVSDRDGAVELDIHGSRAPSYTVFKLQDPVRLVVDVAGGDVSGVASPIRVDRGGVAAVTTAQYQDERSSVGRVVIGLDATARYEVTPRGDSVVVKILPAVTASAASAPAAEHAPAAVPAPAEPKPEPADPAVAAKAVAAPSGEPPAPAADDHVLSRRRDDASVKSPATAILGARVTGKAVVLLTNGPVGSFEVLELRDPPRLAIDLFGVEKAPKRPVAGGASFTQIRFGRDADKVRVVLDAPTAPAGWQVRRSADGLTIRAGSEAAGAPALARAAPAAAPAVVAEAPTAPAPLPRAEVAPRAATLAAKPQRAAIQDVRVSQSGQVARIEIAGKAPFVVSRPDPRTLILVLEGAELPRKAERSLDTSALSGPLLMVSAFNQKASGQVRVVATLRGDASDKIAETSKGLTWTVTSGVAEKHAADESPVVITEASAQAAGFSAAAPEYAITGAPAQKQYTGQRITLDFHDIDVRNLLRLLAEVSKKNIVVADDVSGKITVSLRNVPWDQALDIVLTSKGLGKQEVGNVIRIAKYEVIAKEEAAKLEAAKNRQVLQPLKVRIIPVNFSHATDLVKEVKDVLTDRGTVVVDERTNVLIVKDVQDALARVEGLVRNIDTETPEVLIESRIVEAQTNFSQAIGIQWGGNFTFSPATGNGIPVGFPNVMSGTGASGGGPTTGVQNNPNYAVNLPAAIGQGSGGGIGLVFGSANGAFNLNLRLSALEAKGVVKTISAPKIATLDNKEASIAQGNSIPFSQVSASGVNTTFVEALLELKVTPHVTADGSILMKIKATNNQPNPALTGANGQPSISKRQAETTVLVKDGETTVIGGIYTRTTSKNEQSVPFLGQIPVLGFFFRSNTNEDDHDELLIFITPRVLNRAAAVGGTQPSGT